MMQEEISKLAELIEEKIESIPRELQHVEELYNLDCAVNFLESLVDENSEIEDSGAKQQLIFHLREAKAPAEWVELAERIRVRAGQQLNIFEETRGLTSMDSPIFPESRSA
jgi:hypothetical protein